MSIITNASRERGTHGRRGAGTGVAWASSLTFEKQPHSLIDLALAVKKHLKTL
jgi:hypothetical protein